MVEHRDHQADTYLRSGSNELKILQYTVGEDTFGINILKVSRILADMPAFTAIPESHPAVRGVFNDHDRVIPVMDLKYFFNGEKTDLDGRFRVIVTEFFGMLNAFLVDNVEMVHTVMWEQVKAAQSIMTIGKNPYVISIVQPDEDRMILLLDYETIILELTPERINREMQRGASLQFEGGGRKILLAEDSPSVRSMLQMELEERGFVVLAARDGSEAYDLLSQNPEVALVISDVEMPRTDGLALTKKIKDNPQTQQIPVIVYSSIGDAGMKERAKYLKAEHHITKLNLDELFEKAGQLLGLKVTASEER